MESMIVEALCKDEGILLGGILGSLALLGGTIIAVTSVISFNWRKVRQTEDNNALKQSMLDMGMPADEIAKVIGARPDPQRSFVSFYGPKGRVRCRT